MFLFLLFSCTPVVVRYSGPISGLGSDAETPADTGSQRSSSTQAESENIPEKSSAETIDRPQAIATQEEVKSVEKQVPASSPLVKQEPVVAINPLVSAARSFMGKKVLRVGDKIFRSDCSGLVSASYAKAGRELRGSPKTMHAQAKKENVLSTTPHPGDVVFFDNTFDKNKNGKFDDPITHVGIVEEVFADGRISMLHIGSKRVSRIYLDLKNPNTYKNKEGSIRNSYLRYRYFPKDPNPRLAAQLWIGYGNWGSP